MDKRCPISVQRSDRGEPHRWVILEDSGKPVEKLKPRSDNCGLKEGEMAVGDSLAGLSASLKIQAKPFPIKMTKHMDEMGSSWRCPIIASIRRMKAHQLWLHRDFLEFRWSEKVCGRL